MNRRACKHVLAVRIVREREQGPATEMPEPTDPPEQPKRVTYKQDWPNYNAAQMNEKRLFLPLLADLCRSIVFTPRGGRGRPKLPLGDAVFAAVYKVYSTVSGRRFTTDLQNARDAGHVATAPHYNSVFRVLEDADVTNILKSLIIRSSLPLKSVETAFACDSSGFGTNKFARWFDQKYGVQRKKAVWAKCHVMTGVKTNVVTAAEISDAGDATLFRSLAATTAQNFTPAEFSADKAYSSQANLEFADGLGAVPYIPFKINARGDTRPGVWERMFCEFTLNRGEFLSRYHKRSNVESTFSMVKRKFGDAVRSKSDVAIRNEVLAKLLCHNIVVLIHESLELGIDIDLAPDITEPDILKFPLTHQSGLPQ